MEVLGRIALSPRQRRAAIGGGVGLGVVVVLGGAAAWWAPRAVGERIAAAAAARGLSTEVGGVSIGWSSIGVGVLAVRGAGLEAKASGVRVDAGLVALVWHGSSAVEGAEVDELSVRARLDEPTRALLDDLRGRDRGEASGGESGSSRSVSVDRLMVEIDDAQGRLVEASGRFEAAAGEATLELERVRIGHAPDAALVLSAIRLEAGRAGGPLAFTKGSVGKAELRLAEPGPEEAAAPVDLEPEEEPFEGEAEEEPAPVPAPVPEGPPTTRDRVFAAFRWLRGAPEGAAPPPAAPEAAGGTEGGAAALFERLGAEATLTLGDAHVYGGDGAAVLQALRADVKVAGPDSLRLAGSGKAQGGGSLGWEVQVWPGALRAEGYVEARKVPLSLATPLLPALPWHAPELARLDASLRVKSEGIDRIVLEGEASLSDAALSSPRLAPEPVEGIDASVRGRGQWLPVRRRLEIEEATVALGEVAATLTGAIEVDGEYYLLDVDAKLASTPCTDAVRAIPPALLGDMRHARWGGYLGGRVKLHADARDLDALELDFDVDDDCAFVEVPVMADLRRFREPFTHVVVEPDGGTFEMETGPGTPHWTRLDDISLFLVHAVLAHEDVGFFGHQGFSPGHIRNALVRNLKAGRYVLGASTITMQLVKNIFLRREKTLARKIQEVLLTWWIERVMTKRDILELYLNVIEYGPSVYGVRDGARHYFNRLPGELSPAESVYLSTILPNPKRYHAHFEKRELPASWRERMRSIFARMRQKGWYSPAAIDYGLAELTHFRFVPEGTVTEARDIPGAARPLPFDDEELVDAWEDGEAWWGDEAKAAAPAEPGASADAFDDPPPAPPDPDDVPAPPDEEPE